MSDPIEIAKRWAIRGSRPNMTYAKFNRVLRYYCKKKILQKTAGKRNTYRFQINIQPYLSQIYEFLQSQQLQQQQLMYFNLNNNGSNFGSGQPHQQNQIFWNFKN
jgi:hypothetical protein